MLDNQIWHCQRSLSTLVFFLLLKQPRKLTPNDTTEKCGTEDPRITFFNKTYYLFCTAYDCSNAMLSSAFSTFPMDVTSWQRMGYDLPGRNWSKSGAALFATPENHLTQHYLFWGDSSSPKDGIGKKTFEK